MARGSGWLTVPAAVISIVAISLAAGFIAGSISGRAQVYVISTVLGPYLDFWDSPGQECSGVDAVIAAVNAARKAGRPPDLSLVDRLPGHHLIAGATQVQIIDVQTISCAGMSERFAHVLVIDKNSPLFSHDGYVTASRLNRT